MKLISSIFLNLILATLIAISTILIIYFTQFYQTKYVEELERIRFNQQVYDLAKKLANCLGFEYEKTYYLDYKKIEEFSKIYNDIEPRCAIAKDFDYNVKIIQFEKEVRNYPFPIFEEKPKGKGIAEDILNRIDGKKVIFVLDVSGSMGAADTPPCNGKEFNSGDNTRICCLKKFVIHFLDKLSNDTEIGINFFGVGNCNYNWAVKPYSNISVIYEVAKKQTLSQTPQDGTPILISLYDAAINAENNSYVVLLTDGGENCGGVSLSEVINLIKSKNLTLLSIGFGKGADVGFLKYLKSQVGGEVYEAMNCEELIEKKEEFKQKILKVERKEFSFGMLEKELAGIRSFGPKINLQTSISIPILIKYNETFIVEGLMIINAYKGFLEEFYSFLDDICSKDFDNFEITKQFYFDYNVKILKENDYYKICSENVCKKLVCKYEIEEKEFDKGDNVINVKIENKKIIIR
ncbi:MAG: VWA domain-containing protein [Candidatus Aenigmatarchaeota archaeon]